MNLWALSTEVEEAAAETICLMSVASRVEGSMRRSFVNAISLDQLCFGHENFGCAGSKLRAMSPRPVRKFSMKVIYSVMGQKAF